MYMCIYMSKEKNHIAREGEIRIRKIFDDSRICDCFESKSLRKRFQQKTKKIYKLNFIYIFLRDIFAWWVEWTSVT